MFTQPIPAPSSPGLAVSVSVPAVSTVSAVSALSASPASPTLRTSRLRGLSYLRNYTQAHLLSRDQHQQSSLLQPQAPASSPSAASHTLASADGLLSPAAASPGPSSPSRSNRFSLVPALSHPLGAPPFGSRTHDTNTPTATNTTTTTAAAAAAAAAVHGKRSPEPTEPSTVPSIITTSTPAEPGRLAEFPAQDSTMTRTRSATTSGHEGGSSVDVLPSIRFSTFYDPRATRPSLTFSTISRTLPTGSEIIRVGRYSERDSQPNVPHNAPSAAPVGFKSKVVSRRHCEFWYEEGKWFIKDVKSSSGTFLNHIRLSPPGTESKPFPVNDGDIVQLGIDFKGGEEMIFRCVKMRLELNRGWQSKLNTFNMTTHKRLRNMTAGSANSSSAQSYSQDCSICLNSIAPCQCLFVAPCSHTWHYKCIRSLLASPSYPIFICPNCRAAADLEAEVEDPEEWEQLDSDEGDRAQEGALLHARDSSDSQAALAPPRKSRESTRSARQAQSTPQPREVEVPDVTMLLDAPTYDITEVDDNALTHQRSSTTRPSVSPYSTSNPVPIPSASSSSQRIASGGVSIASDGRRDTRTPSPTGAPVTTTGHEGPITPRNDAGPWVFDGSGARMRVDGTPATPAEGAGVSRINSIEATVADDISMT
ncbi:hypothetical protein B0H67DRAFT_492083 [Lasiosphaeris hirsuta]|uniref:RING-type E3 ubiquitin transferase n=1 Tax=Lasiosphaeris hirsuta TaxID=260670 RepID=A0AA40DS47_9PEZI|nr:hypothetical protein B0H67DRAFT_492083 [Lasiosphaeris hirsuta]